MSLFDIYVWLFPYFVFTCVIVSGAPLIKIFLNDCSIFYFYVQGVGSRFMGRFKTKEEEEPTIQYEEKSQAQNWFDSKETKEEEEERKKFSKSKQVSKGGTIEWY